jgi:hypothetical protein
MRAGFWSLVGVWLLGCSGQHVVGGDEKTKAEQLEASLPTWCQSICAELSACPEDCDCSGDSCSCTGVAEDCTQDCQEGFSRYTKTDECAAVIQRVQQCFDANGCAILSVPGLCGPTEADRAACPAIGDDVDEPPQATPTPGGSSNGSAGSAAMPPSGNTGGPNPTGAPVTCQGAYGAGGGMPAAGSAVTCEEGRDACSDGHGYSWICAVGSQGQTACSCLLDQQVVGAFDPGPGCPTLAQVNAGCGWSLVENF